MRGEGGPSEDRGETAEGGCAGRRGEQELDLEISILNPAKMFINNLR